MQRTNIYLEERQTRALDAMAKAEGLSRAEIIRRLVDRALDDVSSRRSTLIAAIDASAGAATGVESVRRSNSARDRHLAKIGSDAA